MQNITNLENTFQVIIKLFDIITPFTSHRDHLVKSFHAYDLNIIYF